MSFHIIWVMFGLFGVFKESLGAVTDPKTNGELECLLNYYTNYTMMILTCPTFKDCKCPMRRASGPMISSDAQAVAPLTASWIIGLYFKIETHVCAGTLIRLDLVLTAAHCLYNKRNIKIKESDLSIRYLKPHSGNTPNSDSINVNKYRIHQSYENDHLNQYDVAVVVLVKKVPVPLGQGIVCLPGLKDVRFKYAQRSFGGFIDTWNQTLGIVPFQYHSEGSTADIFNIETSAQLCAGDSGSPVLVNCNTQDREGKCLIGVVSRVTRSVTKCAKDITVTNLTYYAIEQFIREIEKNGTTLSNNLNSY